MGNERGGFRAALTSGPVDFTPYLNIGTDTSGSTGFQGSFTLLHVTALGSQTGGATTRIQEGVDTVIATGTVQVHAGTYDEDVNVNKAVSVLGDGAGSTNVRGPIGGPATTMQVTASNVTIAGFTITRLGNNTTDWNNPGLNTGRYRGPGPVYHRPCSCGTTSSPGTGPVSM